jgi:histidine ammonia-lyase
VSGSPRTVAFGDAPLTIEDVMSLARGIARPVLDASPAFRARIDKGADIVAERVRRGPPIYGVTTGFGASSGTEVSAELAAAMPLNLLRYHGCGTGAIFGEAESAAIVAVRLASLSRGLSGVRLVVLERLRDLLAHRILPRIPSEGSVGASGDLTPLSYVAAVIAGEREVTAFGRVMPAAEAFARGGLGAVALVPKESLALMNGTSAMTGLA